MSQNNNQIIYIGIRREDKSHWERRVAIIPDHVKQIQSMNPHIRFIVQPCNKRIFSNKEYEKSGATISEDLSPCVLIVGVKEVPIEKLLDHKTYMFFSHTIKAQHQNMPTLDKILEKHIRLIDYEKITDEHNNRLIAFGRFAGIAGAIDFLSGFGQFLITKQLSTAFLNISLSYKYFNLKQANLQLKMVGKQLQDQEIPYDLRPLIFAVTGTGRCAKGAWEVLENFPIIKVNPDDLEALVQNQDNPQHACHIYVCQIEAQHMAEHIYEKENFNKKDYYENPHNYVQKFAQKYLPYISCIFNNMYWERKYPRLISDQDIKELAEQGQSRLLGVSDVSCDFEGSIEFLKKFTTPDMPFYVYEPISKKIHDDLFYRKNGILYLALDFLPCELPYDASCHFSSQLLNWIQNIAQSDIDKPLEQSGLEDCIKKAVITHQGELTYKYRYIHKLRKANEEVLKQENLMKSQKLGERVISFQSLKIEGHLFDTNAINKILDICQQYKMKFHVAEINAGQTDEQTSNFILQLFGSNKENMIFVLEEIENLAKQINLKIDQSNY